MAFDDFYAPDPEPAPASAPQRQHAPDPDPVSWQAAPLPVMPRAPARPQASPTAQRAKAGLGLMVAAAGAAAGAAFGGPLGCAAGIAGVGALRNLYRSQGLGSSDPIEQGAAAKSLAIALVGGGIAGYLVYKVATKEKHR